MNAIIKYFKQECTLYMLGLEHPNPSDFYISVWQKSRSTVPLLLWRALLLIISLAIIITSFSCYITSAFSVGYWFIYLTHWGLVLLVASTGFGVATSASVYFYGPLSADLKLPWYVKTFWVLHNVSVPVAFLITIFYWTVLYDADFQEEMDRRLNIAVHAVNTLIMLLMLLSSSHPTRFLHMIHPFLFALTYMVFGIIYYHAGGINQLGDRWIYAVVNWSEPGPTILVVFVTGLLLISLHLVTIGLSVARDALAKRIIRHPVTVDLDENGDLRSRTSNSYRSKTYNSRLCTRFSRSQGVDFEYGNNGPCVDVSMPVVTMSAIIKYFKQECKLLMLGLEHPKPSDFYTSVWQNTRSSVPLLIWRVLLFLTSVGIVITSFSFYIISPFSAGYWFIYLTHWGLSLMIASTGFAVATSARVYLYGPISADLNLPWYVKTFWVLHNVSVPVAFLITVFYWTLLYNVDFQEEMDRGLDIAVHAVNTLIMMLMLMSSSHPTRFLHMIHPFLFALTYVVFSAVYYLAGGINPLGDPWIYPVVNWSDPGPTILVVFVTGLLLVSLHFITIGLSAARDALANRIIRPSVTVHLDENVALRTQTANT
ncbi:uncharacterized protein LOC120630762 [Pararge aegeria]|nr:uncharacterized protein LOC120630762 [Pararge aegeria]